MEQIIEDVSSILEEDYHYIVTDNFKAELEILIIDCVREGYLKK